MRAPARTGPGAPSAAAASGGGDSCTLAKPRAAAGKLANARMSDRTLQRAKHDCDAPELRSLSVFHVDCVATCFA